MTAVTPNGGEGAADRLVAVCDKCLQAPCWQGIFMCDEARTAGVVTKPISELRKLGREHPSYWEGVIS